MKTITSKQGTLQGRDFSKGAIVAALGTVLYAVMEALLGAVTAGGIESVLERSTLLRIGTVAVTTFVGYLLKNVGDKSTVVKVVAEGKEAREIIASSEGTNPPPLGDPTHPKQPRP